MKSALDEVVRLLDGAGLIASVHMYSGVSAQLTVAGCTIQVYKSYRETLAIAGAKFRKSANTGYNIRKIVGHVVQMLPHLIAAKDKRQTREELMKIADELGASHKDDKRLTVGWTESAGFYVSFASHEYFEVGIACDKLREIDTGFSERPTAETPTGPPRFRLENADGDPTGDEFSVFQLMGMFVDLTEAEIDEIVSCKLRCRVDLKDFWYVRVS